MQPMSVGDSHAYSISAPNNSHTETSSFTYGTSLTQGFKYTVEAGVEVGEVVFFQRGLGIQFRSDPDLGMG